MWRFVEDTPNCRSSGRRVASSDAGHHFWILRDWSLRLHIEVYVFMIEVYVFMIEVYVFLIEVYVFILKSTSSYWSLHEWPCVLKVFATKPSTGTWRHLVEFPKGQVWSSFWSRSRPFQVPVSLINHMTGPRFCFLGIDIFNELYHQIFQNVPVGSNQAIIFEQWFEYSFEFIRKSTWIWKRWFSDWRIEFT